MSLSHTIESYLRVVIAYWWALLPGLLMPLIDAINWPRAEEKKIKIPTWVRLAVTIGALMVAQFFAYRNSIQNLSTVTEDKREQSITINSLRDGNENQAAQIVGLKQHIRDLEQAGPRIVTLPTPEQPLRIRAVEFGLEQKVAVQQTGKQGRAFVVVGLTNKNISPVDVILTCNHDIEALGQPWIGTTQRVVIVSGLDYKKIDSTSFHITVGSPAWTADSPIGMALFTEDDDTVCSIKQN